MALTLLDAVALSPLQRGLFALSMTAGSWDPYLVRFAMRFDGIDDLDRLRRSWLAVGERHPQLAGNIRSEGLPHPVLLMTAEARIAWRDVDLRGESDPEAAAMRIYHDEGHRRIDLERGPLTRIVAARVGESSYELVCTAHHIVVDGWSIPIMVSDLMELYRADGSSDAADLAAPTPIRQHAAWIAAQDTAASTAAWAAALDGVGDLPMVGPATASTSGAPTIGEAWLTREQTESVARWAREHGLTFNTVAQLAWARILSSLTGRDDVVFGQTTSGRDPSLPGVDKIVGGLVTTIPVRVGVDDRTPADVGARLQKSVAQLRKHEYLGTAEIIRAVGAGQLFDTLLVFENAPTDGLDDGVQLDGGARLTPHRVESPSHYPIAVVPVQSGDRLVVRAEVRSDMLDAFPADRLAARFARVLTNIVAAQRLSDVDVLLDDEPSTLVASRDSPVPLPASVESALHRAARATPDAIAVIDNAGVVTFGDLTARIDQFAAGLVEHGVGLGSMVAVMLPRSADVVAAPFAVARAGGICVHVDPDTPADRLGHILETSGARIVIGDPAAADRVGQTAAALGRDVELVTPHQLWSASPRSLPAIDVSADRRPLYVVFTSGTTGRPKGVAVTHRNLLSHWSTHERSIFAPISGALGRQLRIGHGWSTGFDAAWQPTVALLSGHTVVILDDETRVDADKTVATIVEHEIDIFDTSPSMLTRLVEAGLFGVADEVDRCPLAVLALGGEAINPDVWERLSALPDTRVINFYGPTETTVEVFMATVAEHRAPTLGGPFDTVAAQVLDHRLRPVPPGAQGELYVAGDQVAVGYLGRPDLTSAAFVASDDGVRRYRTGDLVTRANDGTIAFAGRIDDQVKINGYRVEPADSGAVLRELDDVRQAEVLAIREQGRTRLGALMVTDRTIADVRAELSSRLPSYLVPTRFAIVDAIPLNRNDKLDKGVATRLLREAADNVVRTPPVSETEHLVVDLLAELGGLETSGVGLESTLADLGIDSIGVMEVASRLRASGFEVSARHVASATDVRTLAAIADDPPVDLDVDAEPVPTGTVWPLGVVAADAVASGPLERLVQLQAVYLPADIDAQGVGALLDSLALAHPTLRSRLDPQGPQLVVEARPKTIIETTDRSDTTVVDRLADRLEPGAGVMMAAAIIEKSEPAQERLLLVVIHHLATDAVSWHVIMSDLQAIASGEAVAPEAFPPIFDDAPRTDRRHHGAPLGSRFADPDTDLAQHAVRRSIILPADHTADLLTRCASRGISILDALTGITAEASAVDGTVALTLEGHGRGLADDRRVGWFTVERPVLVDTTNSNAATISAADPAIVGDVRLNYLGRLDQLDVSVQPWLPVSQAEFAGLFGTAGINPLPLAHAVDVLVSIARGDDGEPALIAHLSFNGAILDADDIDSYEARWSAAARLYLDDDAPQKAMTLS